MHFVSPPRSSSSSAGTCAPHLIHSYTIPDFSKEKSSFYKGKGFLLLNLSSRTICYQRSMLTKRSQMVLSQSSSKEIAVVPSTYDIVGDIAIFRLSDRCKAQSVAEVIMRVHKNLKTVLAQTGAVTGDFRLRSLSCVAGENRTVTVHKESGCLFSVDVEKCYFSPRLSHERLRISNLVEEGETVINMFAGVGCFSVLIAKNVASARVFSIDINPEAIRFLKENVRRNRVYGKVIPLLGDSETIIKSYLCHIADRVLMPLPEKAFAFLPTALLALKRSGGWVHYYGINHAKKNEDVVEKTKKVVAEKLTALDFKFEVPFSRVVRSVGPNWYQTVLDLHILRFPTNLNNASSYVSMRDES